MAPIHRLRPVPPGFVDRLREFHHPRNADRPPSDWLRELVAEFGDPAPALAELSVRPPDEEAREIALLVFGLVLLDGGVPRSVRDRFGEAAVPVWRDALRAGVVPAQARRMMVPFLSEFAGGLEEEELDAIPSPEETGEEPPSAHLPGEGMEGLEEVLRGLALVEDPRLGRPRGDGRVVGEALQCTVEALEDDPRTGGILSCVAAAAAVEAGVPGVRIVRALEGVAAVRDPEAAWYLEELGRWPGGGRVFERAALLARDLRKSGVVPRPPDAVPFREAIATAVDGAGSRTVLLRLDPREGEPAVFALLLNETRGVLDSWVAYEESEDLLLALRRGAVPFAPVPLDLARSIAGDALHRHRVSGRPVPAIFLLHRPLLGESPLAERPHEPDPRLPAEDPDGGRPPAGKGTGSLADHPFFQQFWFASPEVYAFVRRCRAREGLGPLRRLRIGKALLEEFHREVLPGERAWLLRVLDHCLEIEDLAGRGDARHARLAGEVRRALAAGKVPMETIPFVRVMARRSLEVVDQNVRDGHADQEEANRAGLAEEEEFREELLEAAREFAWSLPSGDLPGDVRRRKR